MSRAGFSVSWTAHGGAITGGLQELQQRSEFVDMTIAADGHLVRVHQLVIGLASPYLKQLIRSTPTPHPVLFLNNVSHSILALILEYIYTGEVIVPADDLKVFVTTGKALHVRGLDDIEFSQEPRSELNDKNNISNIEARTSEVQSTQSVNLQSQIKTSSTHGVQSRDHIQTELIYDSNRCNIRLVDNSEKKTQAPLKRKLDSEQSQCKISKVNSISTEEEIIHADDDGNVISDDNLSCEESNESELKDLKPQVCFCLSNKGGLQMIVNRYMYAHAHTYKDGRRRWECVDSKKKCHAGAITQDSQLINRFRAHNHPRHDKRIMSKVRSKGVYATIDVLQDNSSNSPGE